MSPGLNEEPIACTLAGAERLERRHRWEQLCRRSFTELTRTAEGVTLSFAENPIVEAELRSLVTLERDCCSFARWVLSADGGQLVLRVSAPPDAVAAVQALVTAAAGSR